MDSISTPGDCSPGVRVMEGLLEPGVGGREEVEQVERPPGGGLPPGKESGQVLPRLQPGSQLQRRVRQ